MLTQCKIAAAKKAYRKRYLREKKREHRAQHRTVCIASPLKDVELFEQNAIYHGMELATYVKSSLYAYANQGFILPDTSQVQQLELLLRRIGNNVNQLAHMAHTQAFSYTEGLKAMHAQLNKLEVELSQQLRSPRNLELVIRKEMQRNPLFVKRLHHLLNTDVVKFQPTEISTSAVCSPPLVSGEAES